MDVVLLAEELQEYLEPKIRNSYQILDEISRPAGCEASYLLGAGMNYDNQLEKISCTFLDIGITEADHLGVTFIHNRSGIVWQVASGIEPGVVDFYIKAIRVGEPVSEGWDADKGGWSTDEEQLNLFEDGWTTE